MKLYAIRDNQTGHLVAGLFFSQRQHAKGKRDELNGGPPPEDGVGMRYVVVPGPDNRRFQQ